MSKVFFTMNEEEILNACPNCGSNLEYSSLYQFSKVYKILKDGTISKRFKKRYEGSMECGFISCTNEKCNFATDCDLDVIDDNTIHIYQDEETFVYTVDREK